MKWLDKYDDGGRVKKTSSMEKDKPRYVTTSDPEYRELYNNRQVGAWSPEHQAFNLPDLPEVVVSGKDESLLEAMSQGANKFGQGVLNTLSAPQAYMMRNLTGKQQTPSEAWGFKTTNEPWFHPKPVSNFLMDVVLDPMNLLTVGIADDLAKGAIRQGLKKGVSEGVATGVGHGKSIYNVLKDAKVTVDKVQKLKQLEKTFTTHSGKVPQAQENLKALRLAGRDTDELFTQMIQNDGIGLMPLSSAARMYNNVKGTISNLLSSEVIEPNMIHPNLGDIEQSISYLSSINADKYIDDIFGSTRNQLSDQTVNKLKERPYIFNEIIDDINSGKINQGELYKNIDNYYDDFVNKYTPKKNSTFNPDTHTYLSNQKGFINMAVGGSDRILHEVDGMLFKDRPHLNSGPLTSDFYAYPKYKEFTDRLLSKYIDKTVSPESPILGQLPKEGVDNVYGLIPYMTAKQSDSKALMLKAMGFLKNTPDGAFIPAGSLSSDSYPLGLQMMGRAIKDDPSAKLRFYGYEGTNHMGYVDRMVANPKFLRSELDDHIEELEKITGKTLPKTQIDASGRVMFPKFTLTKGSINQELDEALKNTKATNKVDLLRRAEYSRRRDYPLPEKVKPKKQKISRSSVPPFQGDPDDIIF